MASNAGSPDHVWASVLDSVLHELGDDEVRTLVARSRFLRRDGAHLPVAICHETVALWRRDGRLRSLCAVVSKAAEGLTLAVTPVHRDELRRASPHRRLGDVVVNAANREAHQHMVETARGGHGVALLVGPGGCGKTHLLLGLAQRAVARNPHANVLFLAADRLTLSVVQGVQGENLESVRKELRAPELLIVDGVERLEGRSGSQRELAAAIAHVEAGHGRVVLASCRPPERLRALRPAFRETLEAARTFRLLPPERALRVEILRRRLSRWGVPAVPGAAAWLAGELGDQFGAVDGLLTRVLAHPTCGDGIVDLERHRREMGEIGSLDPAKRPALSDGAVLDPVCRHFNLRLADLLGPGRSPRVTEPRQIAMYLLRHYAGLSYPEIGRRLRRHHTTALHACRRIAERRSDGTRVATAVGLLEKELERVSALRGEDPV